MKGKAGVIPLLEKAVSAQPTTIALRAALVQEHLRVGNSDSALSVAQSGAAANNAPPDASALLASTYERLGSPNWPPKPTASSCPVTSAL